MENLNFINESIRQQLINLETVRTEVNKLKIQNKAEGKLRERLDEMLSTALADLMVLSDFLFDAENCIDENDIEILLEVTANTGIIN